MKIEPGNAVVIVLQNPREKVFGILERLDAAGLVVKGVELNYFDAWTRAIKNGEPYLPLQDCFYPMWRVERITSDTASEGLPTLTEQFEKKTGRSLKEFE